MPVALLPSTDWLAFLSSHIRAFYMHSASWSLNVCVRLELDPALVKVAEEDGIALEPFNLKRERAEGHFDESGHYVEHGRDDAASRDAWLDSGALSGDETTAW